MGRLTCQICFIFFLLSSAAFCQSQKSDFFRRPPPLPLPIPPQPALVEGAPIQDATVEIQLSGVAATTTVDLTLGNPSSVPREASVNLPIAAGQQMARFALDFNGHMRYAVAVEKSRGREVFEAIERRRVDPALLEKTEGDNFRLRVFPILPQATRKARFELIQPATGDVIRVAPPSDAVSKLDHFTARLHISGETAPDVELAGRALHVQAEPGGFVVQINDHQWSNAVPIEVRRHAHKIAAAIDASGKDHWLVADMPVPVAGGTRHIAPVVQLLWDSSASHNKETADIELAELDSYFKAMGNGEVHLQRLRDHAEPMQRFSVNHGDWSELRGALRKTVYDGATALSDFTVEPDVSEILLVSDGLSNYDRKPFPHLSGNQHLFAMSAATSANRDFLNALCTENHGRFVAIDTSRPAGSATRLLMANTADVDVGNTDGITEVVLDRSELAEGHVRVAARVLRDSGRLTLLVSASGKTIQVPVISFDDQTPQQNDLGVFWARYSIAQLAANPDHRGAVRRIGERFQIATDETSLLVLETAADYVRYNVPAPSDLRDEVARMGQGQTQNEAALQAQHLESIVRELNDKKRWYDADYGKRKTWSGKVEDRDVAPPVGLSAAPPPAPASVFAPKQASDLNRVTVTGSNLRRADTETPSPVQSIDLQEEAPATIPATRSAPAASAPAPVAPPAVPGAPSPAPAAVPAPAPPPPAPAAMRAPANMVARRASAANAASAPAGAAKATSDDGAQASDVIHLQPYLPDSPYGQKLRSASSEDLYEMYLDERPDYQASPAFYLDVADLLFAKGQRELGLRVLSNLAELDLNNRQILRVLGYRLMQAKEAELAIMVFKRVQQLAPDEPQSFRDLGLALAAAHRDQEAINNFAEVMLKPWDPRFSEVELITLADLNAVIAAADHPLDTSRVDPRLLVNMPVDVRAVLTWDASDSDLDLWVTDPSGELCRFDHRFTAQGGRLSRDVTTGYGPEEFSLKHAKPGHYRIEVNYFGANAQLVSGVITATVHLTTAFGSAHPQDKALTVRLYRQSDRILIGEFDIQP